MPLSLLWTDLSLALRKARSAPGFSFLIVLTLALGIGTAAAVFAIADAVLLRPLPYHDPDRIAFLWETLPQQNVFEVEATPADYTLFHRLTSIEMLALVDSDNHTIAGTHEAERVRGARVTASTMPLLGIAPALGRAFTPAEDDDSAPPAVILGEGLWRRRYGADTSVLGRTIDVDGVPHTVVGVMPPAAALPGPLGPARELWLPMRMSAGERANTLSHNYTVIARLAPGVPFSRAASEVSSFMAALTSESGEHRGLGARLVPVAEDTVGHLRPALVALVAGVVLLMLVAAANVSTLLLSRAVARGRDAAVRAALGASNGRLFWETTIESTLLALLGAVAGLVFAAALLELFLPLFAGSLPAATQAPELGARTVAIVLGMALALGLAFGAMTARRASADAALGEMLRLGRRTSAAPGATRTRSALVVAQVALAVVLLAGAGVMLRSLVRLAHVTPGFTADRVLSFRLALDEHAYADPAKRAAFASTFVDTLAAARGVSGAALTSRLPLGGSRGASGVDIEGRTPAPGEMVIVDQRHVTADYFRVMAIPLLRGRAFTAADNEHGEPVAIVNRTMAKRYFGDRDPLNRRVRVTAGFDSGHWSRIVGVVDDVRHVSLTRGPVAEMYRPFAQAPDMEFAAVVKSAGDPAAVAPEGRAVIQALDPSVPLFDLMPMTDRLAASFASLRATTLLLGFTAALAAALAAIAIYGAIWYSVSQRTAEIGLRLAIGATPVSVCASIVKRALTMTGIGVAIGTAITAAAAPLLSTLLFETRSADPATIATVIAALLAITVVASIVPARRAISVDPLTALRSE